MKHLRSLLAAALLICLVLAGCAPDVSPEPPLPSDPVPPVSDTPQTPEITEPVDYASSVRLDMGTDTAKQEVTVKTFIDGDTTHFHVPTSVMENGVLKARYLAINTPESTGKIEEYGKAASNFTKEKLSEATSIILESETSGWNPDSTGGRYLVWVWYKTEGMSDYRNLNIEILQNGLAIANSAANNRYGETCVAAINQAKAQKLFLYSGQPDPDYYYGEAIELTLKELRLNTEQYSGKKVAFNGIISANSGTQGVYIEDYDAESGLYYGMYIYYGHGLTGAGLDVLTVGNEARIVGTVQYYEGGGTWQVSDLTYRLMKPDDPGNVQKLSGGHSGAYVVTDPETLLHSQITIETEEGPVTVPYAAMAMGTSVELQNLQVVEIYTTANEDSSSKGAMTLTCQAGDITVTVRTSVLLDENRNLITEEAYLGKTIDVKGIVDCFNGTYQVKVFAAKDILIHE